MKSFSHPNPEAALPGEIVGIYPFRLSPEEAELLGNHLFAVDQDFIISHYLKQEYFHQFLQSTLLSLRRLDLYDDDPIEGLYPEANRYGLASAEAQWFEQMNAVRDYEAFLTSQKIHRTHCYAHCWFGIPREDARMWEDFGDGGHGVCMVSSTHRLLGAIKRDPKLFYELGKVTYWPEDKPLPELHSSTVMFRKRPKFAAENEVRLLVQYRMENLPKDADGYLLPLPERLSTEVDPLALLLAVVCGPQMAQEDMDAIERSIDPKVGIHVLRSPLKLSRAASDR